MTRQVTDQLYIDLEYYYPEDYFVYTAEAVSNLSSQASVTCVIGKLQDATITTQALFTPSISVEVTKNSLAVLDAVVTLSAVPTVNRSTSITIDSIVTQSLQSIRVRYFDSSLSTNFTASCDAEKIIGGVTEEGAAALSIQAALSADATRYVDVVSTQTSAFTQTTTIDKFTGIDASLSVTASQITVVDKFINASSSLASESVITATGLRIRQGVIAVDALFTPNFVVEVTKNSVAVLDSVVTLTATATVNSQATAALTATVTQTTSVGKSLTSSANIRGYFGLLTSNVAGTKRPRALTFSGTYVYTTNNENLGGTRTGKVKYGTHALAFTANSAQAYTSVDTDLLPSANQQFCVEFWWMPLKDKSATQDPIIAMLGSDPTSYTGQISSIPNTVAWAIGYNNNYLQARIQTGSGTFATISTTTGYNGSALQHIALRRDSGGVIRLYYNDTEVGSTTYTGALFLTAPTSNSVFRLTQFDWSVSSPGGSVFDEVSYRVGSSTVSGYTNAITSDPASQQLLYHFDNNANDDVRATYLGAAALTSTAQINVLVAGQTRNVSASLDSAFTLTASVEELAEEGAAALTSQSTLTATPGLLISNEQTLSVVFGSLTANANARLTVASAMVATATQIAQGYRTTENILVAFNLATLTALADDRTREGVITAQVTAEATANVVKTAGANISINTEFSLSAQADSLTSGFEMAAVALVTVTADISRTRAVEASIDSSATQTVDLNKVLRTTATLAAEFAQTVTATTAINVNADFSTLTTLTSTISHIHGADIIANNYATLTADVNKLRNISADLTAVVAQISNAGKNVVNQSNLTSVATVNAVIGKRMTAGATLTSAFAPVMTFKVIHIDPYLTWTIQADRRNYIIASEDLEYTIQIEDLVYNIQREDRTVSVRAETNQFTIKG